MNEEEIFYAAIAKSPEERAAYVMQACAGNAQLRASVEALLAAHEAPGSLLDPSLSPLDAKLLEGAAATLRLGPFTEGRMAESEERVSHPENSQPPRNPQIATIDMRRDTDAGVIIGGRYTLQEKLGEGGMGEVWVAKQTEPVKRKVALKLIKTGMDSRAVLQRFEQERQALALMDHPNIARVLDGGMTATGQPYFVMELVNGLPLTRFCDELKLSLRSRLELFVPICQAVQHAHQKGVVHRDLKPANILVTMIDGKPIPKVIDFGVAKATSGKLTSETMSTGFGAIVGTLEYMSPEQAGFSGEDIDTRADIYSLGVILYELLTGLRPIDAKNLKKAALNEMIRMIQEEEPSKPSTRLSTEATVASLAAVRQIEPKKLAALLRGELDWVVMKCLEKQRERRYETANALVRDIQRYLADEAVEARPPSAGYRLRKMIHRNRVVVMAVSAVAIALVLGIFAFGWQASVASYQRDEAILARMAADEQRDRAIAAEQETLKRAAELRQVSEFQAAMLSEIDLTRAGVLLTNDVLARHSAALAKAGVPEPERDALRQSFAKEWNRVNSVDAAVGFIDREILIPAVRAVDTQFNDQPLVRAQLRSVLASLYSTLGKFDSAQPLAEEVVTARRQELGEEHPDTLIALMDLGWIYVEQAKHEEAESSLREALTLGRAAFGNDHEIARRAGSLLAITLSYRGKHVESEVYARDTYERNRRILGDDDPITLSSMSGLAGTLSMLGRNAEANEMLKSLMDSSRRIFGNDDPSTLVAIANYASVAPPGEDERLIREVLETRRRVLGEDHFETVWAVGLLGNVVAGQGKLDEAEALYREAHTKMQRVRGEDHTNTLAMAANLGSVLRRQGKLEEAEAILRDALDRCRRLYGTKVIEFSFLLQHLAYLLEQEGRLAEDEALLRELLQIREGSQPNAWTTFNTKSILGDALLRQKKLVEAEPLLLDGYRKMKELEAEIPADSRHHLRTAVERLISLYSEWHLAEPDKGYDVKASEWERELEGLKGAVEDAPMEASGS